MRTVDLARIAAEAEGLRLSLMARRAVLRAGLGLAAFMLFLSALGFAQTAAWCAMRAHLDRPATALIMAGADLLIALGFGLAAARTPAGQTEREALAVRQAAVAGLTRTLSVASLMAALLRHVTRGP